MHSIGCVTLVLKNPYKTDVYNRVLGEMLAYTDEVKVRKLAYLNGIFNKHVFMSWDQMNSCHENLIFKHPDE